MSYDTTFKKQKAYDGDNESLSVFYQHTHLQYRLLTLILQDPLLSSEFKSSCQTIEASLSNLGYKLRELERFVSLILTEIISHLLCFFIGVFSYLFTLYRWRWLEQFRIMNHSESQCNITLMNLQNNLPDYVIAMIACKNAQQK